MSINDLNMISHCGLDLFYLLNDSLDSFLLISLMAILI